MAFPSYRHHHGKLSSTGTTPTSDSEDSEERDFIREKMLERASKYKNNVDFSILIVAC